MIRKIVLPFVFFVYGILIALIEEFFMDSLLSAGISTTQINMVTPFLFVIVIVFLLIFEVKPISDKIVTIRYKYMYLIVTILLLVLISFYWIQLIVWK